MPKPTHSSEVRERAVRMVAELRHEHPSEWAFTSIAGKLGMTPETLRVWSAGPRSARACGRD